MEFFNQLLTSYSLLKKRKLHVVMDEAKAVVTGYSDVQKFAQNDTERGAIAKQVIQKVDAAVAAVEGNPMSAEGAQEVLSDPDNPESGKIVKVPRFSNPSDLISITRANGAVSSDGVAGYKNELTNKLWQESLSGKVGAEDGEGLDSETQELLLRNNVSELINLNTEDSTLGSNLIGALGDMYRLSKELGIDSLFSTKTTSIPTKVYQSLLGTKYQVATEEEALQGNLAKYQRPNPEAVLGSLQNLNKVLKLYKKSETTEKLTQDEYDFVKNHINRVSFRQGGRERFRVFVKSNDLEGLGLSFDWETRTTSTDLQNVLNRFEDNLERLSSDGDIDYTGLNYTDITDKVSAGGLGHVIGDVAEEIGPVISLLQQGRTKEVSKIWDALYEKHGKNIEAAFAVSEGAQSGELIGTDETEALNVELKQLMSTYGTTKGGEVLGKLIPTLLNSVGQDMMRMKPDFVVRVGQSRAGTGGDKTDQMMFYKTEEQAIEAAKSAGGVSVKSGTLKDLISKSELDSTKKSYGKSIVNPDQEYYYIDDNLKCTNDPSRTNMGSTAGPLRIAEGFQDTNDSWSQGLVQALGVSPQVAAGARDNFKTVENDIRLLNSIFDGPGSTSVSPAAAKKTFIAALSDESWESLGITTAKERAKIGKLITSAKTDDAQRTIKRKLEQGIITRRIENNSEDSSWRATAALMMMKGCYDTAGGSKMVVDYLTGDHYRYNGNKPMMKKFKQYMETGEGWSSSPGTLGEGSSFGIGGYTAKFQHSKQTGVVGLKFDGPVPKRAKVKTEDSEHTVASLMDKLLEVQQLIFSSLIKE